MSKINLGKVRFTYDDFTEEQLAALKGAKGDKGDAFTYEDFTPEQLASLKGDKGDTGEQGLQGIQGEQGLQGIQGEKGDAFTYEDFTQEQLESLRGPQGEQGIQGEKGEPGTNGTNGQDGATFTPSVDAEGNLSWTNDKGLVNPPTVNIKGEKGDSGVNNIDDNNTRAITTYSSNKIETIKEDLSSQIKEKANLSDVSKISNGTPLFAEDINDMTDNTRNYVNLNDGFLYSYSNNGFINTNLKYQEMGLSNKQVTPDKTSFLNSQVLVNKTISKTLNNANNWWETLETCSVNSEGKLLIMACDDIIINPTPNAGWLQVDFKNSSDSTLGAFSLDYNASSFNKSKVIPEGTEKVVLRACFDWSTMGNLSIEFKNFKLYVDEISLSDNVSVPYLEKEINKLQSIEKVYSIKNISRKGASLTLLHHKPSIDTSITDYMVTPLLKIDDFEYKDLKLKGVPYRDAIEYFDNQKIKIGKLSPVDENYIITENEINIPENATYIRFSYKEIKNESCGYIVQKIKTYDNDEFMSGNFEYYKHLFKTALCIGDSLTEGCNGETGIGIFEYGYPYFLNKITGWDVENAGVSGATAKSYFDNKLQTLDVSNKDNIFIFLGTNDLNSGGYTDTINTDAVGEDYNNYLDTNTGNYCKIVSWVNKNKDAGSHIWLLTLTRFFDDTKTMLTTNETIKKVAEKFNCGVLDIYYKSNFTYDNKETFCPADNVHLTKIGYLELAKLIVDQMGVYINNNKKDFRS